MEINEYFNFLSSTFNSNPVKCFDLNKFIKNQYQQEYSHAKEIYYYLFEHFKDSQSENKWAESFFDFLPNCKEITQKEFDFILIYEKYWDKNHKSVFYQKILTQNIEQNTEFYCKDFLLYATDSIRNNYKDKLKNFANNYALLVKENGNSNLHSFGEQSLFQELNDLVCFLRSQYSLEFNKELKASTNPRKQALLSSQNTLPLIDFDEIIEFVNNNSKIINEIYLDLLNNKALFEYSYGPNNSKLHSVFKDFLATILLSPINNDKFKNLLNIIGINFTEISVTEHRLFENAINVLPLELVKEIFNPNNLVNLKLDTPKVFKSLTGINGIQKGIAGKISSFFIKKAADSYELAYILANFFDVEIKKYMSYTDKNNKTYEGMDNVVKYTQKYLKNQVRIQNINPQLEKAFIEQNADELEKVLSESTTKRKFKI